MNHRLILKSAAAVLMIFGIALVFVPNELMIVYRAEQLNASGVYNTMLFGGTFIGVAVMNWVAGNAPTIADVRYVILGNLVANCAGFAIAIARQLTNAETPQTSWLNVTLYFVFACLFGYLQFAKVPMSGSTRTSIRS